MVDAFGHSKNSDDFCLEVDKIILTIFALKSIKLIIFAALNK